MSDCDVLLIGAPLWDITVQVTESFLDLLSGKKYGMETISESELDSLLTLSGIPRSETVGGSSANVAKTLAHLGTKTAFLGKVGKDLSGKKFIQSLEEIGVISLCKETEGKTGHVLCFVSKDGLRTCRSHLGASEKLNFYDVDPKYFKGIKWFHLEGYSLLKKDFTEKTLKLAKEAHALISFDLGSFEVVRNHKEEILHLIKEYIDIVFGNNLEVEALLNLPPKEACHYLKEFCKVSVVFEGEKGTFVGEKGKKVFHVPAFKVKALDTTGAGDFFAGAFIHSLLNERSLQFCAAVGSFAAAEVVKIFGTDLPESSWIAIKDFMQSLKK